MSQFECILSVDKSSQRCSFKCLSEDELKRHFEYVHLRSCPLSSCNFTTYSGVFLEQHLLTYHRLVSDPHPHHHHHDHCCHYPPPLISPPTLADNTYTTTSTIYPVITAEVPSGVTASPPQVITPCIHSVNGCTGSCLAILRHLTRAVEAATTGSGCESEKVTDKFAELCEGVEASFKPLCQIRVNKEAVYLKVVGKCLSYMYGNGRRYLFVSLQALVSSPSDSAERAESLMTLSAGLAGRQLILSLLELEDDSNITPTAVESDTLKLDKDDFKVRVEKSFTDLVPSWKQEEVCEMLESGDGELIPLLQLLMFVELLRWEVDDVVGSMTN